MTAAMQEFIRSHPSAFLFGVLVSDRLPEGLTFDVYGHRLPTPYGLLRHWMRVNLSGAWRSSATSDGKHAFAIVEPTDQAAVLAAFGPVAHRRLKLFGRPLPTLDYHDGDYSRVAEELGFALDFQPDDSNLICTSLHEVGHLLIGEALSRRGSMYLWRDRPTSAWHGCVQFEEDPSIWPADDRIVVAFAGLIAEETLRKKSGGMTPATIFTEADAQRSGANVLLMSTADLSAARSFELWHIERCNELVLAGATEIRIRARSERARALSTPAGCGEPPPEAKASGLTDEAE